MQKKRKCLPLTLIFLAVFVLSGCRTSQPESMSMITAESSGLWDYYILYSLSRFIIWLSKILGGNYGLGIIVFTIITRIVLLPLNMMQIKSQRQMAEIQPEIDALKEQYPNKDRSSMEALQLAQQELMEEKGVNQFAGCLPLLIQLPVMLALYQVIIRTEELKTGSFLWLDLGQIDPYYILPILAAILVFANTYFMTLSQENQNMMTKSMQYTMPLMILLISFRLPAAVTLYWTISNAINLLQTFIFNNPYKIIKEREAKRAEEKARDRELKRALKRATKR